MTTDDHFNAWKVRWGVRRMRYRVPPGLYVVGNPDELSPVLLSANYKLSFDLLRRELAGRSLWILVLDTKGINVWCAAGKGTFGTAEIVTRVAAAQLSQVVAHRTLIAPQLGAPGVSAHIVKKQCGFRVVYGPVQARDLPAFLDADLTATPEMRRVTFTIRERAAVAPMEIVGAIKPALVALLILLSLSGLGRDGLSLERFLDQAPLSVGLLFLSVLSGTLLSPLLLPWLPWRSFSAKGAVVGLAMTLVAIAAPGLPNDLGAWLDATGWLIAASAISAYLMMNFTGASTLTSPSGVKREMRVAVPLEAIGIVVGLLLWTTGRFL